MSAARLVKMLLVLAVTALAAVALAADKLEFFQDESLSFEHKRGRKEPGAEIETGATTATVGASEPHPPEPRAAPPAAPSSTVPTSGIRLAPGRVITTNSIQRTPPPPGTVLEVPHTPAPAPPLLPPAPPTVRGVSTTSSVGSTVVGAADLGVEVLSVRELTKEERDGLKGKVRCTEPMAAEVRPNARARAMIAGLVKTAEKNLPDTVNWIFSRNGPCFDRTGEPMAKALDALDEAARRMAPLPRGK